LIFVYNNKNMNWQERFLDLKTAISHIQQARESSSGEVLKGAESPFFFIVGSGVSFPPVPLASTIVEHCKEVATKYGRGQQSSKNPMEQYSYYFKEAYPHPKQRQSYLRSLIEGKSISKANLRLAHLLSEDTFTDLVVTPNFDDFLARGLALFGKSYVSCDHPFTISRLDAAKREDIKIIQVHGSYWFYDCVNLSDEIVDRAQRPQDTSQSMASYLDGVLAGRSPLVVGYSGWEGDVIMSALKRRLSNPLGTNLYWFCYKRTNAEDLPDWLKNHANVYFVVPPSAVPQSDEKGASGGSALADKRPREMTLSGQDVLDALIQAYSLPAPKLTKEPLRFFANQLEQSLLLPGDETIPDLYLVKDVIERIRRAEVLLNQAVAGTLPQTNQSLPEVEIKLEKIRDALRRLSYQEAIKGIAKILEEKRPLSTEQLTDLKNALWSHRSQVEEGGWLEALELYNTVIRLLLELIQPKDRATLLQTELAIALVNKGYVLGQLNRFEEAITVYEDIERRYSQSSELALQEWVAIALANKGYVLGQLNRPEEVITVSEEVEKRYSKSSELVLQGCVTKALFNKGVSLKQLNRSEEAIAVFNEIEKRYSKSSELALQEQVAKALYNKGYILGQLNRSEEAITVSEEVEKRYGESSELVLQEQVAKALVNRGYILGQLNRPEEVITVSEEVEKRYSESSELVLQECVAKALYNKGNRLAQFNRFEEAIAVYEEVEKRYGKSNELVLQEQVAKALYNKGASLRQLNRLEDEIAVYEEVEKRYGDSEYVPLVKIVKLSRDSKKMR
jgi:tetratricopeptide (TPR) repeat protein